MSNETYYLKQNVQVEPLFNLWHAYSYLIPPHTAAMVTANYHQGVMKSYLQMPMAHVAALKDPDMAGGPFMNLGGKKLKEVRELKTSTEEKYPDLFEFAEAIRTLQSLLQNKANGFPMLPLYDELPEAVKGFVELTYDILHRPDYRLIESLLYASDLNKTGAQSIALTEIFSDDRPFIFNTPRFPGKDVLHLDLSFADKKVDELCKLRETPQTVNEICERFEIGEEQVPLLNSLLTSEAPKVRPSYDEEGVRVRFFGHACVLFESKDVTVLSDPLISYKYDTEVPRFTFEDLPPVIDYVVITHTHHDHIVLETLLQLRSRIRNVVVPKCGPGTLLDPSMKLILEQIGFESVIEVDDLQRIGDERLKITAIPFYGEHCDLDIRSKAVYHLNFGDSTFLVAADSSNLNPSVYENVHRVMGDVDVLFVGLECTGAPMSWTYGPMFSETIENKLDQERRSNGSNSTTAFQLADVFNCKHAYLYAMGLEPWLNYFMALQHQHTENSDDEVNKMIALCADKGIQAEALFAMKEFVVLEHQVLEQEELTLA